MMVKRAGLIAALLLAAQPALAAERGTEAPRPSTAETKVSASQTLANADTFLAELKATGNHDEFFSLMKRSRGVIIVPSLVKGGLILGAAGGNGVIVPRQGDGWGAPGFVSLGGASVGLQAGAQVVAVAMAVMTDKGLQSFRNSTFKIGADGGLAVAYLGGGVNTSKTIGGADVIAVALAEGLYAGISLDGNVISPDNAANAAYYGAGTRLGDVLDGKISARGGLNNLP